MREIAGAPIRHLAIWWSDMRARRRLGDEFAALDAQGQLDTVLQDAGASRSAMGAILGGAQALGGDAAASRPHAARPSG
jgi:hypothetical protein